MNVSPASAITISDRDHFFLIFNSLPLRMHYTIGRGVMDWEEGTFVLLLTLSRLLLYNPANFTPNDTDGDK